LEREARSRYEAERRRRQEQARLERERAEQLEREQEERLRAEAAERQRFPTTPEWDAEYDRNHGPDSKGDSLVCQDGGYRRFLGDFESAGFGLAGSERQHLSRDGRSFAWDFLIEEAVRQRSPATAPILQFVKKNGDLVWRDAGVPERAYLFDYQSFNQYSQMYQRLNQYSRMSYASEQEIQYFAIASTTALTAHTSQVNRREADYLLAASDVQKTYRQALEVYYSSNFHDASKSYELTFKDATTRNALLINTGSRSLRLQSENSTVELATTDPKIGEAKQSTPVQPGVYVCIPGLIQQRVVRRLDQVVTDKYGQQSVEPRYIALIITDIPYTEDNQN